MIADTSAWAQVTPSSFEINLPSWDVANSFVEALGLPLTNNLQLQFYDASNISLVDAAGISGWMSAFLYGFPEASVMLWDCTNMLVASNTFYDQGNAMLLYGGSNNTVWGNTFLPTPVAATNPTSVDDSGLSITGINETESGDLVYNNLFEVGIPAITPTYDPFQCDQYGYCYFVSYNDTWNVSEQPATNYTLVAGWNLNLTGSIIGTSYQGGNYWSNYGTQADPYGVLPYNDSSAITNGGDYVPLVAITLSLVTFTESGLPIGTSWGVNLTIGLAFTSNSSTVTFSEANGTYNYTLATPAGYQGSGSGNFTVNGSSVSLSVSFVPLVPVTFWESGLVPGWTWSVSVVAPVNESGVGGTSSASSIVLDLPGGSPAVQYSGQASAFEFPTVNWSTSVGTSPTTIPVVFALANGTLVLQVTPAGATVTVNNQSVALAANGTVTVPMAPGVYSVEVTDGGYLPYFNNVSVTSAQVTSVTVSLTSIPTAGVSPAAWAAIGLLAVLAVVLLGIALVYRSRGRRPPPPKPLEPAAVSVAAPTVADSATVPSPEWSEK